MLGRHLFEFQLMSHVTVTHLRLHFGELFKH